MGGSRRESVADDVNDERHQEEQQFTTFVEGLFWLRIFISPFLIGVIAGLVCWFTLEVPGKILAVLFGAGGLLGGYFLAEYARRGHGTTFFMSRVIATPDIDRPRLVRDLDSDDPTIVHEALLNLDMLGRFPREAEPTLKKLREHDDPQIAERAEAALLQLQA